MTDSWDRLSLSLYAIEAVCSQLTFLTSLLFPFPKWIGVTLTLFTFTTALLISIRWRRKAEE